MDQHDTSWYVLGRIREAVDAALPDGWILSADDTLPSPAAEADELARGLRLLGELLSARSLASEQSSV